MSTQLTEPRWTHVAIPVSDMKKSLDFYTNVTPLTVVSMREEDDSSVAWLSNPNQVQWPFVLVMAQFGPEMMARFNMKPGEKATTLAPFAHIGIEMPDKADVDAAAAYGKKMGVLRRDVEERPQPVGYVCSLFDPDGNVVEFSYDQRVYSTVMELWGGGTAQATEAAVRAYIAALNSRDPAQVAACVTEDFFNEHITANGRSVRGREAYQARFTDFVQEFADLHYEIEDLMVDGDRAGCAYRMTYNWRGGAGAPKPVVTRGMFRFVVREGLIAHRVDYRDSAASAKQMGLAPDAERA